MKQNQPFTEISANVQNANAMKPSKREYPQVEAPPSSAQDVSTIEQPPVTEHSKAEYQESLLGNPLHQGRPQPTQDASVQLIDELKKQHAMEKNALLTELSAHKTQSEKNEAKLKAISEQLKEEKCDKVAILKKYVTSAAAERTCEENLAIAESELAMRRKELEPLQQILGFFYTLLSAVLKRSNRLSLLLDIQTPEEAVNAIYNEWDSLCYQNESLQKQLTEQLELKVAATNECETLYRKVAVYEKEVGDLKSTVTRQKSVLKSFMGRIRNLEGDIRRLMNWIRNLGDEVPEAKREANDH